MKAIAIAVIALVVIVVAAVALPAMNKFGLYPLHQRAEAMNAQSNGLQPNETFHQVWDSGLNPFGDLATTATAIYWLDESTLLFTADKYPKPATSQDAPMRTPWLYLWRLGEKPQPHGADPQDASRFFRAGRGALCFYQNGVLMLGPPGQEREAARWDIRRKGQPLNGIPGYIESIDCDQFVDPAMVGRIFTTDSYRHYYLDRAADPPGLVPGMTESPVLMKSDGSVRKVLPIPAAEVGYVYFRTFDNVFWILEDPLLGASPSGGPGVAGSPKWKWKATNCLAVWRVDPESGSADRSCIPFGSWSGRGAADSSGYPASISLVPTAKGVFFTSTHYTDGTPADPGPSGLYKLENGAARRVIAGYVEGAVSSPSGCRVAFTYGPNLLTHEYGTSGSWSIVAIDLCTREPRQAD